MKEEKGNNIRLCPLTDDEGCSGYLCAWWDDEEDKCAILVMAQNKKYFTE